MSSLGDSPPDLSLDESKTADRIASALRPGCRVLLGDGAGAPIGLLRPLAEAARRVGGVELILGWQIAAISALSRESFPIVRTYMAGFGLSRADIPQLQYVPTRLSSMPALVASVWRPDVLLLGLRPGPSGLCFGPEAAWMPAALGSATTILAELNHELPLASREPAIAGNVDVVAEVQRLPAVLPLARQSAVGDQIGRMVASFVPEGASVQVGPGLVGDATLRAIDVPVRIESGVVTDAVVALDERGLLLGDAVGAYVAGTQDLYKWADGRELAARVEYSHDLTRLSALQLIAVNAALEIDQVGQVNVEGVAGRMIAGIGGHPDFAAAAARSPRGLSIIALPTSRGEHSTLVERLRTPVSTARSDVDIVVTELGFADLRGRSDAERSALLSEIWP